MMKPSLRRPKWIYATLDLELGQGSYGILKKLQTTKSKVLVWETEGSDFNRSDPNLSRYFLP
jgi:hypothetical protein